MMHDDDASQNGSENFMFGLPGSADEDKLFLIDFGLSSR